MPSIVGDQNIAFGLTQDYLGLQATTSVQSVSKRDKKELKGYTGGLQAIAYFNPTTEYTVEGYGNISATIGDEVEIDLPTANGPGGKIVIEEVTYTRTNEDFIKSSLKAVRYHELT